MLDFKDITLEDKKIFDAYYQNYHMINAEMSFSHLFAWGQNSWVQIAEEDDCLFVKYNYSGYKPCLLAPIPKTLNNYQKYLQIALDYFKEIKVNPKFYAVSEPFIKYFDECNIFTKEYDRDASEYVYSTEKLINLSGKKLQKKRNFINRITSNYPNFGYRDYTSSDYQTCMDLFDNWHKYHDEETIDLFDERLSIELMLKHLDELDMKAGVIEIDNRLVAFSIGDLLNSQMAHIHVEKAVNDIEGIYPLINKEFLNHNFKNTILVNREEDMGLDGLRKAKESYYPEHLIEKYTYTLK